MPLGLGAELDAFAGWTECVPLLHTKTHKAQHQCAEIKANELVAKLVFVGIILTAVRFMHCVHMFLAVVRYQPFTTACQLKLTFKHFYVGSDVISILYHC